MTARLHWFPFEVDRWLTSKAVLSLTMEQRGIYVWLLCRQWMDGHLPYDVNDLYPLMPNGVNGPAVAYVLVRFFPPDPDTNERRNPKLAQVRIEQDGKYAKKLATLTQARGVKALKRRHSNQVSTQVSNQDKRKKKTVHSTGRTTAASQKPEQRQQPVRLRESLDSVLEELTESPDE